MTSNREIIDFMFSEVRVAYKFDKRLLPFSSTTSIFPTKVRKMLYV